MKVVKQSALQDQWRIHYIIQSLRWDKMMARDIRTILNAFQLVSRFVCHVFKSPDMPITYLPTGWLPYIRDQLLILGGSILIEDAWKPHLHQLEDDSTMEAIATNTTLIPNEKLVDNECRMWLGVITTSDIADMDGQSIQLRQLCGFW